MIIDGKEYVLKESVEKDYILKTESKGQDKFKPECHIMDEVNVMALGSAELNDEWRGSKVNIDYLKKAIAILEKVTHDKKRESCVVVVSKDYPLLLGDVKDNKFSGVIIAPRVEQD